MPSTTRRGMPNSSALLAIIAHVVSSTAESRVLHKQHHPEAFPAQ